MKISIRRTTLGLYGGGFYGNLRFFGRYIQSVLEIEQFVSTFDELSITLSYPPVNCDKQFASLLPAFQANHVKLPSLRIGRKDRRLDVILPATEFSAYFEEGDKRRDLRQGNISPVSGFDEVEIAMQLLSKVEWSFDLIEPKLKKGEVFEFDKAKQILSTIRKQLTTEFLEKVDRVQSAENQQSRLERAISLRTIRKDHLRPRQVEVRDLRLYTHGFPPKLLYPFDYIYTEIFLVLLRKNELLCPTFHHLYIHVARSREEALVASMATEDWHEGAVAVLSPEEFDRKSSSEKSTAVFDLIVAGLNDFAELDGLDRSCIAKVVDEVSIRHLETELIHKVVENSSHVLTISYLCKSIEEGSPVFFNLMNKTSLAQKKVQVGTARIDQIPLWIQKVELTKSTIRVFSSDSIRADVYLKGKTRSLELEIETLDA